MASVLLSLLVALLAGAFVSVGITYVLGRRRERDVRRLEDVLARERSLRRTAEADEVAALALAAAAREEITALAELPQRRIEQLTKRRVIIHMDSSSIEGTLWAIYADSIVLRQATFFLDDQTVTNLDGDQIIPLERIGWIQELSAAPVRIAESLASVGE